MRLTRSTASNRRPATLAAVQAAMLATTLVACGGPAPEAQPAATAATPEARTSMAVSEADARAAGIETAAARTVERSESLQASGHRHLRRASDRPTGIAGRGRGRRDQRPAR